MVLLRTRTGHAVPTALLMMSWLKPALLQHHHVARICPVGYGSTAASQEAIISSFFPDLFQQGITAIGSPGRELILAILGGIPVQ